MSILVAIISWFCVGLGSGFLVRKFVNTGTDGSIRDAVLGIGGAVAGGLAFDVLGPGAAAGFDVRSILASLVGATCVLVIYHFAVGHRRML